MPGESHSRSSSRILSLTQSRSQDPRCDILEPTAHNSRRPRSLSQTARETQRPRGRARLRTCCAASAPLGWEVRPGTCLGLRGAMRNWSRSDRCTSHGCQRCVSIPPLSSYTEHTLQAAVYSVTSSFRRSQSQARTHPSLSNPHCMLGPSARSSIPLASSSPHSLELDHQTFRAVSAWLLAHPWNANVSSSHRLSKPDSDAPARRVRTPLSGFKLDLSTS